ncbi:MAG: DUF2254 domain-containing protein [Deltaproteobacteria bacterium]|nr:DUF2254 domain-containing protein [Deltaproteobacteria bacterium]
MSTLHDLQFRARQVVYDLRTGLLFRPATMTLQAALLALALPWLESQPDVERPLTALLGPFVAGEPGAAQLLLTTIAASVMTTLSVVYSVLLMALSLASVQFSPRILGNFLRSRSSQTTLGLFTGTFVYCLLVLRTVRTAGNGFVPILAVAAALLMALICLAALLYTLHDIAHSIQANTIADRIAVETLQVLEEVMPPGQVDPSATAQSPSVPAAAVAVPARAAGYVQLVDHTALLELAQALKGTLILAVAEGEFASPGDPLVWLSTAQAPDADQLVQLRAAFDLGSSRTMQQDVEFGVRQIVDVALKAISPAINDPSTACTCIDQLGRILGAAVQRPLPWSELSHGGAGRVLRRPPDTLRLIDLAFAQLRQYGHGDMAVSLRLLRMANHVVRLSVRSADKARLTHHVELLAAAALPRFAAGDCEELQMRLARFRSAAAPA